MWVGIIAHGGEKIFGFQKNPRTFAARFIHLVSTHFIYRAKEGGNYMLIIEIQDGEQLDKALRRFKKKFEKVGILKETRRRMSYSKPSEVKKEVKKKAVSRQRYYMKENF